MGTETRLPVWFNSMESAVKGPGCLIIAFAGMFGSLLLFPIAAQVIKTGDLVMIARIVYLEMAIFSLIGGVVLALRQSDTAYGLGIGVAVAAAILAAVYLSYNLPAHSAFDLGGNSHYTHYIGIPLSLGGCWAGFLGTHYLRVRFPGRKRARTGTAASAEAKRCARCDRRKPLGQRWETFKGKLYCPDCLGSAKKLAEDTERIEALYESQVRSGLEGLNNLRQRLEDLAHGKGGNVEALQGPSRALAARLLDDFNRNFTDRHLKEIKTTDRNWFAKSGALDDRHQALAKMLIEPSLEFLTNNQASQGEEGVRVALAQCLELARKRRIDYHYFKGPHGFPIDFMIGLAAMDHKTTLDELYRVVSNPDETPWVLQQTIIALGQIGDRGASEALLAVLNRPDPWGNLISSAACALVDLKDEQVALSVIQSIGSFSSGNYDDWNGREYVAEGLGKLLTPGTEIYEEVCTQWMENKVSGNRVMVKVLEVALFEAGGRAAVRIAKEKVEQDYTSAMDGVKALVKQIEDQEAFSALCQVACQTRTFYRHDPETQVTSEDGTNTEHRLLALEAIARQGGEQAKTVLSQAAGDPDSQVSGAVARLLQEIEKT
ncbi:MAG: hypothetical protein C0410_13905 [Anaerolinea sp.]|nr:hypothetical protein [Anaerolinea sp.]